MFQPFFILSNWFIFFFLPEKGVEKGGRVGGEAAELAADYLRKVLRYYLQTNNQPNILDRYENTFSSEVFSL